MAGTGSLPEQNFFLDSCPLLCPACRGIFVDPVTDYCGHTYCSFCLEDLEFCTRCSHEGRDQPTFSPLHGLRVNVTLAQLVEKLAGVEPSIRLKKEAYALYKSSKFVEASVMVGDAIFQDGARKVSGDFVFLLLLRSKCFLSLGRLTEALGDVEAVLRVTDRNVQAHILKAHAMRGTSKSEDGGSGRPVRFDLTGTGSIEQDMKGIELAISDIIKCPSSSATTSLPSLSGMPSSSSSSGMQLSTSKRSHSHSADGDARVSGQGLDESHWANVAPYQCCAPIYHRNISGGDQQRLYGSEDIPGHDGIKDDTDRNWNSVAESSSNTERLISSAEKLRSGANEGGCGSSRRAGGGDGDATMGSRQESGPNRKQCCRSCRSDSTLKSTTSSAQKNSVLIDGPTAECIKKMMKLVTSEDVECTLCYRIFLDPITTPCGHVFCLECMYRSLDHSPKCPLCKEALCSFLATRPVTSTEALVWLTEQCFREQLNQRKQAQLSELTTQESLLKGEGVPIFVCTAAYPSVRCLLHVFEPRYKLMVRRCLKSGTRQFGMCNYSESQDFIDVGTMLEIADVQYLTDGRSVLQTVGRRRFRVLERVVKDGYYTAKVGYISDDPIPEDQIPETTNLVTRVYQKCRSWFSSLGGCKTEQITQHYGPFPDFETPRFVPLPPRPGAPSSEPVTTGAAVATSVTPATTTCGDSVLLKMTLDCPLLSSIRACRQAAKRQREKAPPAAAASSSPSSMLLFSEDGPSWVWYMLAILPLKNDIKTCLLGSTSVKCRLQALDTILTTVCSRPCS